MMKCISLLLSSAATWTDIKMMTTASMHAQLEHSSLLLPDESIAQQELVLSDPHRTLRLSA